MNQPAAELRVRVARRTDVGDQVVVLELEAAGAAPLPAWTPGSHIDVLLPGGDVRQYSLCGNPGEARWQIAVLREPSGRGGSEWIFGQVGEGTELPLAGPRNHFSFAPPAGTPVLLIAGGIGVTPLLPMALDAVAQGTPFAFHYAGHEGRMPFADQVAALRGAHLHVSERGERIDVRRVLSAAPAGTQVWVCGPGSLVDEVERIGGELGLTVHEERFVAREVGAPAWQDEFEVELVATGQTVTVPVGRSILDVVEEAGVFVLSSCHEGTCGTCETRVLEGAVDHRDSILTPAERDRGDTMYICVSRAAGPRLVLDL